MIQKTITPYPGAISRVLTMEEVSVDFLVHSSVDWTTPPGCRRHYWDQIKLPQDRLVPIKVTLALTYFSPSSFLFSSSAALPGCLSLKNSNAL